MRFQPVPHEFLGSFAVSALAMDLLCRIVGDGGTGKTTFVKVGRALSPSPRDSTRDLVLIYRIASPDRRV